MIKVLWLTGDLKNQQEAEDQKDRPSVFVCVYECDDSLQMLPTKPD